MHGVAALLAAAAGAHLLARLLRAPSIPLLIVAGMALSWLHAPGTEIVESGLVIGVAFLLFVFGLELDPRRIRVQRRAVLWVGSVQFAVLAVLGFLAARALGFGITEAGFVALALPASSTLVAVRLLRRRQHLYEPVGRLVLGVLLLQDALVVLAIPLVTDLDQGWGAILVGTGGVGVLAALALATRVWIAPRLLEVVDEGELLLLGSLGILFLFVGAASAFDLPIVVGAFLAGAGLSRFPVNGVVRSELAPIADFFTAIFFVALGALVRLPTPVEALQAGVLVLLVVVVTPPLVAAVAEWTGFTTKAGLEAGLLLAQTSEISLVVGLAGMIEGDLTESHFVVIALATLVTMLVTPMISTDGVATRLARLRRVRPPRDGRRRSGHVVVLGAGSTGMPLVEDLIVSGCAVTVVDDDPAVVERLTDAGVHAIRGDASDPRVLREAGAQGARAISSELRRPRDNETLLALAPDVPVLVRVFDEADAAWVRARGGRPVLYAEASASGLMEWFEERRESLRRDAAARAGDPPVRA